MVRWSVRQATKDTYKYLWKFSWFSFFIIFLILLALFIVATEHLLYNSFYAFVNESVLFLFLPFSNFNIPYTPVHNLNILFCLITSLFVFTSMIFMLIIIFFTVYFTDIISKSFATYGPTRPCFIILYNSINSIWF